MKKEEENRAINGVDDWGRFAASGKVEDYLRYKSRGRENVSDAVDDVMGTAEIFTDWDNADRKR